MTNKLLSLSVIFLIILMPFISAITGSIGNAKAIVNVNLKESNILERTVFIQNVNNVSIAVNLEPADDLEDITEILDKEFTLSPGETKNARYKVTIPKEGTYNGNIVVFFKPAEGKGAGVVLQSNLIIKASGTGQTTVTNTKPPTTNNNDNNADNQITGTTIKETNSGLSLGAIFFIALIAIVLISGFIVLMRKIWKNLIKKYFLDYSYY